MPSFRMHLPIGELLPGRGPAEVMEQAALALGTLHTVEKRDVEAPLVGGRRVGRLMLRFSIDTAGRENEDRAAREALRIVVEHLEDTVARIEPAEAVVLTRGTGGSFRPIGLIGAR